MSLLRSGFKRGTDETRFGVDEYVQLINQFQYNGLSYGLGNSGGIQQTLAGQPAEKIGSDFVGLVQGAYAANGVVFSCMLARQAVFSGARFQWQQFRKGRPGALFGTPELALLEQPWPGGTTQDLLSRVMQDADLAGNSYWARNGTELIRMRPDWVDIVARKRIVHGGQVGWERAGYLYTEGGDAGTNPVPFLATEVAHFAPIPDPLATFRGMSWLTPIVREIQADGLMTRHKRKFLENGATSNLIIRHAEGATEEKAKRFKEMLDEKHMGVDNAYKTLHLYPGADATVVGSNLQQVDFKAVQGGGETRIASASGVPPIIVGLSEGLAASTYCGTYDDPVWTPRGVVKLGEIQPGEAVWSYVGDQVEPRKVTWHSQTGVKPVYTIRTKNRSIRFTDNHPILVRVPGSSTVGANADRVSSVEWRRVDDLKVGDRVVQAQHLPDQGSTFLPDGTPATPDVLQWLGAYTGDGCKSGGGIAMCMPPQDRAREHYEALARRLFDRDKSWVRHGRRSKDGLTDRMVELRAEGLTYRQIVAEMGIGLHPMSVRDRVHIATRQFVSEVVPIHISESRNGFRFHSTRAAEWHDRMGITGKAATKRVPPWVYELTEELRLAYLAGIVDSDGSIGKDGRLAVGFANRQLVEDVRMLAISCEVACSNIAEVNLRAHVLPNPGTKETYTLWRFVASSAVDVGRIPFADAVYRERVNAHQHRHRRGGGDAAKAGLHEDLGFYAIRSIEVGPAEPVYDIEVEDGHSFLVDGVVVHNSNYGQARRRFADGTIHPLWMNISGSLSVLFDKPPGQRLWYDTSDVPFLREDEKDAAEIAATQAATINSLVNSGFTSDSAISAIQARDWSILQHSGLVSVQLQAPGTTPADAATPTPTAGAANA